MNIHTSQSVSACLIVTYIPEHLTLPIFADIVHHQLFGSRKLRLKKEQAKWDLQKFLSNFYAPSFFDQEHIILQMSVSVFPSVENFTETLNSFSYTIFYWNSYYYMVIRTYHISKYEFAPISKFEKSSQKTSCKYFDHKLKSGKIEANTVYSHWLIGLFLAHLSTECSVSYCDHSLSVSVHLSVHPQFSCLHSSIYKY